MKSLVKNELNRLLSRDEYSCSRFTNCPLKTERERENRFLNFTQINPGRQKHVIQAGFIYFKIEPRFEIMFSTTSKPSGNVQINAV